MLSAGILLILIGGAISAWAGAADNYVPVQDVTGRVAGRLNLGGWLMFIAGIVLCFLRGWEYGLGSTIGGLAYWALAVMTWTTLVIKSLCGKPVHPLEARVRKEAVLAVLAALRYCQAVNQQDADRAIGSAIHLCRSVIASGARNLTTEMRATLRTGRYTSRANADKFETLEHLEHATSHLEEARGHANASDWGEAAEKLGRAAARLMPGWFAKHGLT